METFRAICQFLCGVCSLVGVFLLAKARKEGDTNDIIACGFYALIMLLVWQL